METEHTPSGSRNPELGRSVNLAAPLTAPSEKIRKTVGYTPIPPASVTRPKSESSRSKILAAIAAVSIAAIGITLLVTFKKTEPQNAKSQLVAVLQSQKTFHVSYQDLDVQATENARAALRQGRIPPFLAGVPEKTRQELISGEQSLYSVRLLDFADEDGDVVEISLNDVAFGEVILSNSGAKLTIPLKNGDSTKIVCLATSDGGGGVTFRAISSTGELRTHVMGLGESENWVISFQ